MPDGHVLSDVAVRGLRRIWDYGADRWSEDRADEYVLGLGRAFALISAHPEIGRARDDVDDGLRVHSHQTHVILYRVRSGGVRIVRVLVARQDWERAPLA